MSRYELSKEFWKGVILDNLELNEKLSEDEIDDICYELMGDDELWQEIDTMAQHYINVYKNGGNK